MFVLLLQSLWLEYASASFDASLFGALIGRETGGDNVAANRREKLSRAMMQKLSCEAMGSVINELVPMCTRSRGFGILLWL
mmetsp:Transcript_4279/g.8246  ORF Transcript_4279/g.8246 Transcript_4279/m.8246 type:complete len:81 (+) Transcript_4279:465-707(+)